MEAHSQLNLQVGYGLAIVNLDQAQNLLDKYRPNNRALSGDFAPVRSLNGFYAGIHYSGTLAGLGLAWKYQFADTGAEGIDPNNNASYSQEFFFNLQCISLTLDLGKSWISFGTSLDYNMLRIKEKHTGIDDTHEISNEGQWGSQFHMRIKFPASSTCQISLQAYYSLPWKDFSLKALHDELQSVEPMAPSQSLKHFGICLILSNGPQD